MWGAHDHTRVVREDTVRISFAPSHYRLSLDDDADAKVVRRTRFSTPETLSRAVNARARAYASPMSSIRVAMSESPFMSCACTPSTSMAAVAQAHAHLGGGNDEVAVKVLLAA